jgi:glutamyl-tRNA synthetase
LKNDPFSANIEEYMTTPKGKEIRVRMAPSPTGFLHIGTARTTLFNWLFARHEGGTFVLRIEDTDKERSKPEHEVSLMENLKWLGIAWDEGPDVGGEYGPYRQSERTEIYKEYIKKVMADGHAYYCYCTKEELEAQKQSMEVDGLPPKYSGRCRNLTEPLEGREPQVIRFKTPEIKIKFHDLIRGTVEFDAGLFGDMVIAKDLDTILFNFANVIDDYLMKITHVIRGDDHIANTPKQIIFQRVLGFPEMIYAHVPLVLNGDRSKMSKRNNESSFSMYRDQGYLPEAMMNFLAMLGWHPNGDEELLSPDQLIAEFDIERVQKAGAVFNMEKLDWINAQYLKKLSVDELAERLAPFFAAQGIDATDSTFIKKVIAADRDRMKTLGSWIEDAKFFFALPDYDAALLIWKDASAEATSATLEAVAAAIGGIDSDLLSRDVLMNALQPLMDAQGKGNVLWPLRASLSGKKASPDPLLIAENLGKAETLARIEIARKKLESLTK